MKKSLSVIAAILISASASAQNSIEIESRALVVELQGLAKNVALAEQATKCDVLNSSYASLNAKANALYDSTLANSALTGTSTEDEVIQSLEALTILKSRYSC